MLNINKKFGAQLGIGLIELLIGTLLATILGAAIVSVFVSAIATHTDQQRIMVLEEELGSVMQAILNELGRAGYSRAAYDGVYAVSGAQAVENPFGRVMVGGAAADLSTAGAGVCIMFSYDYDPSDTISTSIPTYAVSGTVSDFTGFKFDAGEIKMMTAFTAPGVYWDDAAWRCDEGTQNWEAITSTWALSGVELDFAISTTDAISGGSGASMDITTIVATISGSTGLPGGRSATRSLQESIKIVNDFVQGGALNSP